MEGFIRQVVAFLFLANSARLSGVAGAQEKGDTATGGSSALYEVEVKEVGDAAGEDPSAHVQACINHRKSHCPGTKHTSSRGLHDVLVELNLLS